MQSARDRANRLSIFVLDSMRPLEGFESCTCVKGRRAYRIYQRVSHLECYFSFAYLRDTVHLMWESLLEACFVWHRHSFDQREFLSSLAEWENGRILPHQHLLMSQLSFVDRNWSISERQGYSVLPIDSPCPSTHSIRTFENDLHRWLSRSSVTQSVRLCSLNPHFSLWWLIVNKSHPIRRCIRWPTRVKRREREKERERTFFQPKSIYNIVQTINQWFALVLESQFSMVNNRSRFVHLQQSSPGMFTVRSIDFS